MMVSECSLQAKIPFDEEELQYIAGLDADSDVQFLRQELPWLPEGSLRTLQVRPPPKTYHKAAITCLAALICHCLVLWA